MSLISIAVDFGVTQVSTATGASTPSEEEPVRRSLGVRHQQLRRTRRNGIDERRGPRPREMLRDDNGNPMTGVLSTAPRLGERTSVAGLCHHD